MRRIGPGEFAAIILWLVLQFGGLLPSLPSIGLPWPSWFTPAGPRHLVIVRESADDTPDVARLLTNLREGAIAQQLAAAGHRVTILDDDDRDAAGQPVPVLEAYKPFTLPELLVLTQQDKLVRRLKLPDSATQVVEAAK